LTWRTLYLGAVAEPKSDHRLLGQGCAISKDQNCGPSLLVTPQSDLLAYTLGVWDQCHPFLPPLLPTPGPLFWKSLPDVHRTFGGAGAPST
jgi:hypothetical protein